MTNNSELEQKNRVLKSLAIAGFVGLIIIISWLGIQLVKALPNAFSSLASLADSVYSYDPVGITAAANKDSIATTESATISWSVPKRTGSFAFSYECSEGLALSMRDSLGAIKDLQCGTNYAVGSVSAIDIIARSEKTRFADLQYRIDFIASGKSEPSMSDVGTITVVNASISAGGLAIEPSPLPGTGSTGEKPKPDIATTTPSTPAPATTTKPEISAPAPAKPAPTPKPVYTQTPVYGIPTSNPNGFTDLAATFVASGMMEGTVFKNTALIDNDGTGAIQFAVKNLGTKTSNTWTYSATLPNGETFTSTSQLALKPNERAVITLGFSMGDSVGVKRYSVAVSITPDSNKSNNQFETVIAVVE